MFYPRQPAPEPLAAPMTSSMTSSDALTDWRRLDAVTRSAVKDQAVRGRPHHRQRVAAVSARYAGAALARPTAWIYAVVVGVLVVVPVALLWDAEDMSWPDRLVVVALASVLPIAITAQILRGRRERLLRILTANREPRAFAPLVSAPGTPVGGARLTARVTARRLLRADTIPLGMLLWLLIGVALLFSSGERPNVLGYLIILVIMLFQRFAAMLRWLYWLRGNRTALIVAADGVVIPGVPDIRLTWEDIAEVRLLPLPALYRNGRPGDTVVAFVPADRRRLSGERDTPRWGDVRTDFFALPDGWLAPAADEIASAVVRLSDVPVVDYR
ncbi:hypothetical protein AB0O34_28490 [Sphaerisporangium sp. NPDC088356]|uniref:hypothetical protein n=1 Tax=Sphaerisporangium sp. NPDC088356 TaxID=3154871 RepID=UPI0034356E23